MSDKPKFKRIDAERVAYILMDSLAPSCEKIMIAGSIRRQKPFVGDVELLYISKTQVRQDPADMFGKITVNLADEIIQMFEKSGVLERRKNSIGLETYGQKNKLMRYVPSGMPVDLFGTTQDNWNVSVVIRTGSLETNLKLATGARKLGRSLKAYGSGVELSDGSIIQATSEEHVFELCGVPYLQPHQR